MLKVAVVFGTRPEAIKMAPVIRELNKAWAAFRSVIVVTAQHRELLDQVIGPFEIVPDYDFGIMKPGQDVFDVTSSVLLRLRDTIGKEKPDIVLVHGDTTTALAASLAAYYMKISIGHVEAGLRTHDKYRPFPEEVNRKVIATLADLHFAPTSNAKRNLLAEGVAESDILVTGNTGVDALLMALEKTGDNDYRGPSPDAARTVLVTTHRRESFGLGLENICLAIKELALANPDVEFVFPVHPNPNVRGPASSILAGLANVTIEGPIEYLHFVKLMKRSYMILTDSGGIQEEAPTLGKPVLVMRDLTERPEAIEAGTALLVGTNRKGIVEAASRLLTDDELYHAMSVARNPYGDGKASERIVAALAGLRGRS